MLNLIWGIFIIGGVILSIFTGKSDTMTNAIISGGKEAVELAVTMLGIVATWTGIMKIAEKGGLIKQLSKKADPILTFLFPDIPKKHPARGYIATNFAANFLGLGWAATPAGLLAMKELNKLNKNKDIASDAMCMFLIINMSSLQLVTVNILAYRSQYNSSNPSEVIFAGILATLVSTIAGVVSAKVFSKKD